jgi:hypothetical protein
VHFVGAGWMGGVVVGAWTEEVVLVGVVNEERGAVV